MNPFIYARKVPEFREELMKYMRSVDTRNRLWILSVSSSQAKETPSELTASVSLRDTTRWGRFNYQTKGRLTV